MELKAQEDLTQPKSKENDDNYEAYLRENVRRDEELIKFIDEFINSEEFHLVQVQNRHTEIINSRSECICTECWERVKKVDLVKRAQEIWVAKRRFEKHLKNKHAEDIMKQQKKSIKIIKESIVEAKARYLCHKEEREQIKENYKQKVLDDLKNVYGVNTKHLSTKGRVVDKVLAYYKVRYTQRKRRKERMISIIRRIINEYKRQREIDELKNRRYDTKVIRKKRTFKSLEIIGTKIELLSQHKSTIEIATSEEPSEIVQLEQPKLEKEDKKVVTEDKSKNDKESGKPEKIAKKGKVEKPGKKENDAKGGKKGKKPELEKEKNLVLPYVPQNKRYKIKSEETQKMEDLIEEFELMKVFEQEKDKLEKQKELSKGVFYAEDSLFYCQPKSIIFHGFKSGVIYKKRIKVYNGGHVEKKCRFYVVRLDEIDPLLVEVEPVGIQTVIPGMYFNVTVTFTPETLDKPVDGNIMFITYQASKKEYLQISVPISCIPWCSHVNIKPEVITFESLPIWKAKQICDYKNCKILKFINTGKKPCKIIINKIRDPLHLNNTPSQPSELISEIKNLEKSDEIMFIKEKKYSTNNLENNEYELYVSTHESEIFVKQVMDECIECVFNTFIFSSYCFHVEGNSEKCVKVFFRNVDHVGYYNEKYLISIFEKFDDNVLSCIGSQICHKVAKGMRYSYSKIKTLAWRHLTRKSKTKLFTSRI